MRRVETTSRDWGAGSREARPGLLATVDLPPSIPSPARGEAALDLWNE